MKNESINICTVCGSDQLKESFVCKDHFVSGEDFHILLCSDCGFYFTSPRPIHSNIGPYYESEEYISHSKNKSGIINRLFHIARTYTIANKRRALQKFSPGKNILDYGCGTGEFLHEMNAKGWTCTGIEPSENPKKHAIEKYGLNVGDEQLLENIPEASLDSITLWHVLEHVYPIEERLQSFHRLLKPGGTLFIALPNSESWDALHYKQYWAAWDVPRHIHHFSPTSIEKLLSNNNFELIRTKPMYLDAIYISMLSEKYRSGSQKNLKGMFFGLRSNWHAFLNKKNYSSLIYIFKKLN